MFRHAPLEVFLIRVRCPRCGADVENPFSGGMDWLPTQVQEAAAITETAEAAMCGQCGLFVTPEQPRWLKQAVDGEVRRAEAGLAAEGDEDAG